MTRREDAATATVGLTGVAGAAAAREHVIRRATKASGGTRPKAPRPPSTVLLRRMPGRGKLRAAYVGTTALGLTAGVPAVTGTAGLFRRREPVIKTTSEERIRAFIGTGVKGSGQALREKAANVREPVPAKYRAGQAGVGLGAGALGAQATHHLLNRAGRLGGHRTRAAATAIGATLTGAATLPATSAGINRISHGKYRATSTGVVRAKKPRKPASSKATLIQNGRPTPRGFEKALQSDYPYKGLTRGQKRARVYAAGAVPGPLGPINAARQAARMAPPEQKRSAAATQYASSQGGKYAGMAAGAYGAAALARKAPAVQRGADRFQAAKGRLVHRVARAVHPKLGQRVAQRSYKTGPGLLERNIAGASRGRGPQRHLGRALARAHGPLKGVGGAAVVGGLVGGFAGGNVGSYTGYSHVLDREEARNAKIRKQGPARRGTRISKGAPTTPGMSRRETQAQIKRKRRNIAIGTLSGTGGLGSLAMLGAAGLPKVPHAARGRLVRAATYTGTASAGLGGVGTLESQRIARRDVRAQEKSLKLVSASKADTDPIKAYGDRGPLPKGLPRAEKMRAYEARVAHHGGRKAKKWQRRADVSEVVRNAGLAGLTGAAGIGLVRRSPRVAALARKTPLHRVADSPKVHGHGKTLAEGAGFVAGSAELYGEYARHRRASYKSSPGGAAQSALTRMQRNTPGGS